MGSVPLVGTALLTVYAFACLVTGHFAEAHFQFDPLCLTGLSLSLFAFAAARRPRPTKAARG